MDLWWWGWSYWDSIGTYCKTVRNVFASLILTIAHIQVVGFGQRSILHDMLCTWQLYFSSKDLWNRICFPVADIDECWNSCACPTGHGCVNLEGSYECRPPEPGNQFRFFHQKIYLAPSTKSVNCATPFFNNWPVRRF